MGHTNSTTNYNLPQFITTDKPAWLTDVNNAYSAIDIGIHAAKTAADTAQGDATTALGNAGTAQTTANTADGKASGAIASISEAFLDSSTYAVGDLVIYNNLLYKCHTAVVTPGAWTGSANWSRTDVDTLLSETPKALGDLDNVDLDTPAVGQVLAYNGTKWLNSNALDTKQNKNVMNIVKSYNSGTSIDAINAIINEYGKVSMMFAYSIAGTGQFMGAMTFHSSVLGGGYIVNNSGRFWSVVYENGVITLSEK